MGALYVIGVIEDLGTSVLMEWHLGSRPYCHLAVIAHDLPISMLAYGPYDNGPLLTADACGICRIWDCVPQLQCAQVYHADVDASVHLAVAVEPRRSFYLMMGDKFLYVWRRLQNPMYAPKWRLAGAVGDASGFGDTGCSH